MYRGIKDSIDQNRLQSDIDNLVHWSTTWQLLFIPAKCKHMSFSHLCNTTNYKTTQSDGKVFNIEKSSIERKFGNRDQFWSDIFRAHTFGFKESKWNYGCYKEKL